MIKLLLVDDEVLARIGLTTMLDYESMGLQLLDSVSNGAEALEIIQKERPDIVITDIRMPTMSGLELIEHCNQTMENPPKFIVLTSYEDFEYIRQSLREGVIDYLIKLELTPDSLTQALVKAIAHIAPEKTERSAHVSEEILLNKFFMSLLMGAFASKEAIFAESDRLKLALEAPGYSLSILKLGLNPSENHDSYSEYVAVLDMAKTTMNRFLPSWIIAYDNHGIGMITPTQQKAQSEQVLAGLEQVIKMSEKYFSIPLQVVICHEIPTIEEISRALLGIQKTKDNLSDTNITEITYQLWDDLKNQEKQKIDMIGVALQTSDHQQFFSIMNDVKAYIMQSNISLPQSIDILSRIVNLCLEKIVCGRHVLSHAFSAEKEGYQALYHAQSKQEVLRYVAEVQTLVTKELNRQVRDPKSQIVLNAQEYIQKNIRQRISLNDPVS